MLQLLLSPVLLLRSWLAGALSCALYALGTSYYFYLTFLGYSALPFLERTEVSGALSVAMYRHHGRRWLRHSALPSRLASRPAGGRVAWPDLSSSSILCLQVFLYPIGGVLASLPVCVLLGLNPTKLVLKLYFNYH